MPKEKRKILVVEDEIIIADDLIRSLEQLGYEVLGHAMSWAEALKLCTNALPDLAIMDIHIRGETDGIESARQLRELFSVPSIFLTAYSDEKTLARARQAEPYGYLLKPFDEQSIRAAVEIALYKHEMETRLRRSEEWFSTTMRCIGDGVIATNLEGRIIYMNAAAEKITGWTESEALQRNVVDVFRVSHGDTGMLHENTAAMAMMSNMIVGLADTAMLTPKSGKPIPVDDSAAPILNRSGEITGAVIVFRDDTLKRETFQQRARIERLESLGLLAGGIAHDFNNLLAIIQSHAQLLTITGGDEAQHGSALKAINTATQRARELTHRFITFSKAHPQEKKRMDLGVLVREVAALGFAGTSVRCDIQIPKDQYFVFVDQDDLENVFSNLFLNARQAMSKGGTVTVTAASVSPEKAVRELDLSIPGQVTQYVSVSVADTGSGISPENLERIFEPYFTTKTDGNGLGLSICHSLIAHMDGKLTVASEIGKGTVFTVTLPLTGMPPEDKGKAAPVAVEEVVPGSGRILFVDDEELLREIVMAILQSLGYSPVCVANGETGIEKYKEALKTDKPFDLVLTDCNMPGHLSGQETVRRIREIDPAARFIVCSGYCNEETDWFKELKICDFIAKPFQINKLAAMLSRCMAQAVPCA